MFKIPPFISKFKTALKTRKAKKNLFKIYLDLDFQFYSVDFDELVAVNYVYKENELYDQSIAGITTFLKLQKPNKKEYEFYPDIYYSQLKKNQEYAVITYSFTGAYSTRAVALVQSLRLDSIEIFKKNIMKIKSLRNIDLNDWEQHLDVEVKQFIEFYIKHNNIENINSDYFEIGKPLENHEKYSRILSTIEKYANGIIHYERNLESNVLLKMKDYRKLSESNFRKFNLPTDHIEEWVFDIVFKLTIVCISGYAIENSNFRKRLKIRHHNLTAMILRILLFPISIFFWLLFSFSIFKGLKNLYYYLFYPVNGFLYLLILTIMAGASYLLYKLLTNGFSSSLNEMLKIEKIPWQAYSIVGFVGFVGGISSESMYSYLLRKDFPYNISDSDMMWEISSLKVVLSALPFMALFMALFYTVLFMPAILFDKKN